MIKRPFEQWFFEDVELAFGLERIEDFLPLMDWLNISTQVNLNNGLENLRKSLSRNVETWNEDELKMMFIAPFLLQFDFNHPPTYRVFTQRFTTLKTENVEASGRVEWMVSTGKQRPRKPFFFLQAYKPEKNSETDPLGQLLIAMVNAQISNNDKNKPLYGCYNLGRFWFFILLIDQKYGVSRAYDATQVDDMSDMIVILNRVVTHIKTELNVPFD